MHLRKCLFPVLMVFLAAGMGFAYDFGQILDQKADWENDEFEYSGAAAPWFSMRLGEKANLYISASFAMDYEDTEWALIPELTRTELVLRPLTGITAEIGRLDFNDPLGIIAAGLFDGARASMGIKGNRLSLGGFYTGLLYRGSAHITMADADQDLKLDYSNFGDTYFASRRILGFLRWEMPAVSGTPVSLTVDTLAQFDVNSRNETLNSQYLTLQALFSPANALNVNLGTVLGLVEIADTNINAGFAGSASLIWRLPTPLEDFASLGILLSSGTFRPVTAVPQGKIFTPKLSGLIAARGGYTLGLMENLLLSAEAACFIRTRDDVDNADPQSASPFLGTEFVGTVKWGPVSDVYIVLEGGAFLPGSAMLDTAARGKLSLELVLSF